MHCSARSFMILNFKVNSPVFKKKPIKTRNFKNQKIYKTRELKEVAYGKVFCHNFC